MGCCCSQPPPKTPSDDEKNNGYPIPVIPVAAVHDSSIFDSPFKANKKESEASLLTASEKAQVKRNEESESSSSSVDQEMIKQLLSEVDVSD